MADLVLKTTFTDTTNCCGGSTTCYLTMPTTLIDGTTTNYANSTAATAAIADQAGGCIIEGRSQGSDTRTSFSASFSAGTLTIASNYSYATFGGDLLIFRCNLTAADGISVVYSSTTSGGMGSNFTISLYQDDQTTVVSTTTVAEPASGTFSPSVSTDGYYYIRASVGGLGITASTISLSCTGGASFTPCYVRAAYDDGAGGTAYVICV